MSTKILNFRKKGSTHERSSSRVAIDLIGSLGTELHFKLTNRKREIVSIQYPVNKTLELNGVP